MGKVKIRLQPIDVEGQPQQHGLPLLRLITPPRRFRRKLPFDRGKHALDLRPLRVLLAPCASPHLSTHAFILPRRFAAPGRDDALGTKHLPDVLMVALRVKLGVRKHQPDWCHLLRRIDQRSQGCTVSHSRN